MTAHYQALNWVERDRGGRLEQLITEDLLALPNCGQKHKDIQQGKNRAPNTLASMLTDAFKKEQSVPKVTRLAHTILAYFTPTNCRELNQLHAVETEEQGDVDTVQMRVAQGDTSTPTLRKLVEELDEYILVAQEMRSAALGQLMRSQP